MPAWTSLKVGSRIRLLRVPDADLKQREDEHARNMPDAGWTADSLERAIAQHPVVSIFEIDEYGHPWFEVTIRELDGRETEHRFFVLDDESWEFV